MSHPLLLILILIMEYIFFYFRLKTDDDFEHHADLSQLKFVDAAKIINIGGVHILVDISGHVKGAQNEIFTLRPAPIHVSNILKV